MEELKKAIDANLDLKEQIDFGTQNRFGRYTFHV